MNALTSFNFQGSNVRTVELNTEPWFVLADLCNILGIANARNVAARLDEDMKGVHQIDTLGGKQSMTIVSEAGMYDVIVRSDSPVATPFRRWLTTEVLPSIRKQGGYLTPEATEKALTDPDFIIRLATELKESRAQVAAMAPKAQYVDDFVAPGHNLTFRQLASSINIQEKQLRHLLISRKWIYAETYERWSKKKKSYEDRTRYSAYADKRSYFFAKPEHKAPLFMGQVMHTLYVTPSGAVAINRLVKSLRDGAQILTQNPKLEVVK